MNRKLYPEEVLNLEIGDIIKGEAHGLFAFGKIVRFSPHHVTFENQDGVLDTLEWELVYELFVHNQFVKLSPKERKMANTLRFR